MEILEQLLNGIGPLLPVGLAVTGVLVILFVARAILEKRVARVSEGRFRLQLIMLALSIAGLLVIIMTLPVSESSRGQLLSLFGILLSAALALSSTTLIGNMMAGAMLRAVRGFRAGDFIKVDEHFGRVSERGLFHVEIQTEDRDLTTLPNLFVATHPVTVVNTEGTIVSAALSLGYDISHARIEKLLIEAALKAELEDPFVRILELGDFSVTYRVGGLLAEVKRILTARSDLRASILDVVQDAGVEIVSPNFMNTRAISAEKPVIPARRQQKAEDKSRAKAAPESIVFDKAEQAALLENLRERHRLLGEEIKMLEQSRGEIKEDSTREELDARVERLKNQQERLAAYLESEAQADDKR